MISFFSQRLGNAYVVGLGGCELMKIWFKQDGESNSVFTEEDAKDFAEGVVEFLKGKYDESKFDEEDFGGSSEFNQAMLDLYDKMCRVVKE